MGMWCLRAVATIWRKWAIVSCSFSVSASMLYNLPSGWRKSLYRSMRTMAVGASREEDVPGEVCLDIVEWGCGTKVGDRKGLMRTR